MGIALQEATQPQMRRPQRGAQAVGGHTCRQTDGGRQRDTLGRGEGGRKSQRGAAGPETGGRGCVEGRATDMWRDCGRAAPGGVTVRCCGEMCRLGGVGYCVRLVWAGAGMRACIVC